MGYGYTAKFFAARLIEQGWQIYGTQRELNSVTVNAQGVTLLPFNSLNIEKLIRSCSAIVISIPPNDQGYDPIFEQYQNALFAARENLAWIAYLSSTAIYGDHQGRWVDETAASIDLDRRGRRRLQAEQNWLHLGKAQQLPIHIFRLAGIYGPGRNVLRRLRAGKNSCIYKPGHFFSRIHVADIAGVLQQSLLNPTMNEVYNVADDYPAAAYEVEEYAAKLLNLQPLERIAYAKAALSPMAQSFYRANRRVSNQKIKTVLNYQLQFPNYQRGLAALIDDLS